VGSLLALLLRALGTGIRDRNGVLAPGTYSVNSFTTSQPSKELSQVFLDFLQVPNAAGAVQAPFGTVTEPSSCFPLFDVASPPPPAGTNSVGVVAPENVCATGGVVPREVTEPHLAAGEHRT